MTFHYLEPYDEFEPYRGLVWNHMTNSNHIEDYFSEEQIILSGFHIFGNMINLNHVEVSDHTVDYVLTYGTNYHMVKTTIFCDHITVWDHF